MIWSLETVGPHWPRSGYRRAKRSLELSRTTCKLPKTSRSSAQTRVVERQFEEGGLVFLRLQPYKQSTLKQKGGKKLKPCFYEPYRVNMRVGEVAYGLELTPGSKVHNVFTSHT